MESQTNRNLPRVRLARRIGMGLVSLLIVWTIVAVTVGVIGTLRDNSATISAEE